LASQERPVKYPPPDVLANAGPSRRAFQKLVNDWRIHPFEDVHLDCPEGGKSSRLEGMA
jgi:hypothetical protein